MRKLGLKDAFFLGRIIKAANLRDEIIAFAKEVTAGKTTEEIGFEFIVTLITSISDPKAEKMIYELYADIKGVDPAEVPLYDLATLKADFKTIAEENDLADFFNSALPLISKQLNS